MLSAREAAASFTIPSTIAPSGLSPDQLDGLMYIPSTGCQWRALPKDLPARSTMHFCAWHQFG